MKLLNAGLWIIMLGLFGLQMYVFAEVFQGLEWDGVMHPPRSVLLFTLSVLVIGVVVSLTRRARRPR